MDVKDDVVGCCSAALVALMLSACATRDAPDVRGRWQPVNRYADTTHAIPLRGAYVFQASPLDRTLRSLLARWARDTQMTLDYRHHADFTLHLPVQALRAQRLEDAAAQLSEVYAAHDVLVAVDGDRLVVTRREADPG
ncbi:MULTISPECIES: hypothetical protein [unclassified Luteimonas]|uniref:hypothetical protein n=1 Tax=unclassified Luteimonas TaxID=2629088 RepID=UPI0015FFAFF6|nr:MULTISPECIES: hypothetical protein [unclassified Luteimonas]MBB1471441.1 hypothetical protein [Luteimonas sp. MC1782]MBB6599820.1 hypothetical protein [Luteimonas sp. MC1825]QOC87492.1 hypothetical protein IDM46_09530 [Luteimonas sp. MC1825]